MDLIAFGRNYNGIESHFISYLEIPFSFEEAVARLYHLVEYNIFDVVDYKSSFEITGKFGDQIFTLYDYKEDMQIHIGGADELDVESLKETLLKLMTGTNPKPYRAKTSYNAHIEYGFPPLE